MAIRDLLVFAATAALATAQGPAATAAGCTAKSFAIPSWLVTDVKHAGADVSFSIANRATNYTATLACQGKTAGWNACEVKGEGEPVEASVLVGDTSTAFSVKQTWTCKDREKALTFTANGNATALLSYTSPLLIRGSLTSPVSITPTYADGATGHDSPGCSARSAKPSWVLSSVQYTDEPADGVTATPFRNFNVIVTNQANGYQASCMPGGGFAGVGDVSRLTCAGYEFQAFNVGRYPISTEASYDAATSTFSLNQTWFCDDVDAAKPVQLTARASLPIPLSCTTLPSPTSPNLTNSYCTSTSSSLALSAASSQSTPLPAYSLTDPVPSSRGDGCTLTSIFAPKWQFSDFEIVGGEVRFEVILTAQDRGFQYPIPIYQGKKVEGREGWWECVVGEDGGNGLPLWPNKCRFGWEEKGGRLGVEAEWECRDLDGGHPVKFSGVTTTTVNSAITCETVDGESRCTTEDPGYTWTAGIDNVKWGA